VCGGEAVVNGVGGFGKDRGEETDWDRKGVVDSFEGGYGFAWFEAVCRLVLRLLAE
jgi:hypothetical protein